VNRDLTTLNVLSTYQVFDLFNNLRLSKAALVTCFVSGSLQLLQGIVVVFNAGNGSVDVATPSSNSTLNSIKYLYVKVAIFQAAPTVMLLLYHFI
jgi:hypothetical protein